MYQELGIRKEVVELVNKCEKECQEEFKKIDDICEYNSIKVLNAFQKNRISEAYNYNLNIKLNDLNRLKINHTAMENIVNVFKTLYYFKYQNLLGLFFLDDSFTSSLLLFI